LQVGTQVKIDGVGTTVLPHLREGGADVVLEGSRDGIVAVLVAESLLCILFFHANAF
jgi:hypothetical protein